MPLILIHTAGGKRHVVALCGAAHAAGVRIGMTLAGAKALCAGLRCEPHEPDRDLRALESLGRWLMRYTPDVALDPPDALLLNVGGCERLFGGLDTLASSVRSDLQRLSINAKSAIAPTASAAWALATYSSPASLCTAGQLSLALRPLPIEALRLEPEVAGKLRQLGIRTVGQVTQLPREALPSRFGAALGMQLDRAHGQLPEILVWLAHRSPIRETIECEDGVRSLEGVWYVLGQLIDKACGELARRGCGARLLRVGLRDANSVWTWTDVALARSSRRSANLFELVRCALDEINAKRTSDSYTGFEVAVPLFCPIDDGQIELLDQARHDTDRERERLIGRLVARLGADALVRPQSVESHLPERAYVDQSVNVDSASTVARSVHEAKPAAMRPLCLLPMPVEVRVVVEPSDAYEGRPRQLTYAGRVHTLVHVKGPERIAGEWWRGHYKTRDYFDVLDERGLRFWLFRVTALGGGGRITSRWFLQGRFA